jgi:hypothetical protein
VDEHDINNDAAGTDSFIVEYTKEYKLATPTPEHGNATPCSPSLASTTATSTPEVLPVATPASSDEPRADTSIRPTQFVLH